MLFAASAPSCMMRSHRATFSFYRATIPAEPDFKLSLTPSPPNLQTKPKQIHKCIISDEEIITNLPP